MILETKQRTDLIPAGARNHSISSYLDRLHLPEHATPLKLLGVDYAHLPTSDGGDLYITWDGIHLLEYLRIENWHERQWFEENRLRLPGTSMVYRLPTKPVNGRSIDLVVKYCRVGEDLPLDTITLERFSHAEFNSPYEELSLVTEMRSRHVGPRVLTNRPLGIYVPAERFQPWQTGREKSRIAGKKARYRDVELDIFRQYILIYQWIKGVSADQALFGVAEADRRKILEQLTERVRGDLERSGYMVIDHKPAHIIVRQRKDGALLRDRKGDYAYALVDFELLARTPDHQRDVRLSRRSSYLRRQRNRFSIPICAENFPKHLKPVTILGIDYISGHAESTRGRLWVVGHDPELFDYFLPERWRHTPGKKLSKTSETHYTLTKDNIDLVWKVSRVGESPDGASQDIGAADILAHGFNSPFEEFAIALDLIRKGIPAIHPRAIYMSGLESSRSALSVVDNRRFESHKALVMEDGRPLLRADHNYLTIWGYWTGSAEGPVDLDEGYSQPVNLGEAWKLDMIKRRLLEELLERITEQLSQAGYRDLALKPSHLLLSLRHDKSLVMDSGGVPIVRVCNFASMQATDADEKGRI